MRYLLDTCIISELIKPYPDKKIISWLKNEPSQSLFLCVITIGEIRKGLSKLPVSGKKEKLTSCLEKIFKISLISAYSFYGNNKTRTAC